MELTGKQVAQMKETDHLCLWTQAGVVKRKKCRIDYECSECRFDMVMRRVSHENLVKRRSGDTPPGNRAGIVLWKDKLKAKALSKRPCIHHMKGRIEFRSCTNEYRCGSCDFDQYFNDQYSVHAVVNPVEVMGVKGFKIPQGYYFHKGHTWAKVEESYSVRIGIDDFALRLMGPPDRIESPLLGKEIKQGRADIMVIRGHNHARLISPVSGIVTAINPGLREDGSLANKAPYSDGWIMKVQSNSLRQDMRQLMINTETGEYLDSQVGQLYQMIEDTAGPLASDGGYLGGDIFGSMPELGWDRLVNTFFSNETEKTPC